MNLKRSNQSWHQGCSCRRWIPLNWWGGLLQNIFCHSRFFELPVLVMMPYLFCGILLSVIVDALQLVVMQWPLFQIFVVIHFDVDLKFQVMQFCSQNGLEFGCGLIEDGLHILCISFQTSKFSIENTWLQHHVQIVWLDLEWWDF